LGGKYHIFEAPNGLRGLEKALKYLPGLVICDVMMPGMDGYELCARLKTDIRTCHIPVIILTAKATTKDQLESIETGADVYISKPFDIQLLEKHVHQLLTTREQLKMRYQRELTIRPSDIVVESTDESLMNRIIKVMSENISNPDFGVEELGREVGISRTHLYRKLKQLTNLTAIEFVRNMRLQRASQLFKQNKLYVAEVAYMSGFKELSYFRKIFKELYGISPQDYISRENHPDKDD
jgi:YesN/AraC family two-component response regulator